MASIAPTSGTVLIEQVDGLFILCIDMCPPDWELVLTMAWEAYQKPECHKKRSRDNHGRSAVPGSRAGGKDCTVAS